MSTAETGSRAHRGTQKAEPRFSAETLLLRLPCGGELFADWRFAVEHDHVADEFDKGSDAFGGIGFFCPKRDGDGQFEPCPRLVHIGHLLAAEDLAPSEAAAFAAPARNCDRFKNAGEAHKAWRATDQERDFTDWLFAKAEGKEVSNG